jgi:hypothetical protein
LIALCFMGDKNWPLSYAQVVFVFTPPGSSSIPTPAGRGAFCVVHLGVNKGSGEHVAVKSISKAKLVCKEDAQDMQAEVTIMKHSWGTPTTSCCGWAGWI